MTKLHENLDNKTTKIKQASNKETGLLFSFVIFLIGLWPITKNNPPILWLLIISLIIALVSFSKPRLLYPLSLSWSYLGRLLNTLLSPVILLLIYVLTVIPTGIYLRLTRKDPLKLNFDSNKESYWIIRSHQKPDHESFYNQF